jgi:hypothetical protein
MTTRPSIIAQSADHYRQIVWSLTCAHHAARQRGGTLVLELHEMRTPAGIGFRLTGDIVGGVGRYEA